MILLLREVMEVKQELLGFLEVEKLEGCPLNVSVSQFACSGLMYLLQVQIVICLGGSAVLFEL